MRQLASISDDRRFFIERKLKKSGNISLYLVRLQYTNFLYRMLKQTIEHDMRESMKAKDELRLSTLRMALASMRNREIEKRGKGGDEILTEDEVVAVLKSEAKKRRDAAEEYHKAGREELGAKEDAERLIIEHYLPKEISDEEIEKILQPLVAGMLMKDFGRLMGAAMKVIAGRASGDRVSMILKRLLAERD